MANISTVSVRRVAITSVGAFSLLLGATHTSFAQNPESTPGPWEFRLSSGTFTPTRNDGVLEEGQVTAAQVSRLLGSRLAITGTFAWARSRDLASTSSPKLNVFTTDLGVEARPAQWFAGSLVSISPFVGVGAGMRSYDYRKIDAQATHNVAGYGAVGGELGIGRVGLRLEVRDYVTGFRPLVGAGSSETRNDVVFTAALRFNRQRAPKN